MNTYYIPRETKGEGRILFIFSTKALIYTAVGVGIGLIFYFIFSLIKLNVVGIIISLIFGLIGFCVGTFKVPNSKAFEITRKTGGENIDDIVKRAVNFYKNKNKLYVYKEEETKDE